MRISGVTYASRKTHKFRNTLLLFLILVLAALLAIAGISAYQGWGLLHPERKGIGSFSSNTVPEFRDVSFRSADKSIVLKGWFFQTVSSDRTVVLVHSYRNNRLQFGQSTINMIKDFLKKGYNVLAFDLRGSGESGGDTVSFGAGEKQDIIGAMNYIKQQGTKHIILMGFSTGASASILASAGSSGVDAVIADSPYSDLGEYFRDSLDKWTNLPSFPFNQAILISMQLLGSLDTGGASPIDSVSKGGSARVLLIHGRGDGIIPAKNSEDLYKAYGRISGDSSELWLTDSTGDADSYLKDPTGYMTRVFAFLDKVKTGQ